MQHNVLHFFLPVPGEITSLVIQPACSFWQLKKTLLH